MAKNKKNILTNSQNRLIYVEPNCSDREIPDTEDFSISVELTSTKKSRTTLIDGEVSSTKGSSRPIGFIDGTNIGGTRRSLTTNYTEIGTRFTTENKFGEDENDLETLGIESIDITFDTAYTPMIKIKFIDIRGNAVLSKGNESRYKMFFDLPFPIFDLTVKGFYGKAVKYCLHLSRWNASFNSGTGNFEIDTEFIGYTYALLTDCLLGYMRATVFTKIGATKLQEYQNMPLLDENDNPVKLGTEIVKKYPKLTSIEDFLDYIKKIDDEFSAVKSDDESIKQLNSLTELSGSINEIERRLDELKRTSVSDRERDLFKGTEPKLALLAKVNYSNSSDGRTRIKSRIKKYQTVQKGQISSINKNIEIDELKLNYDKIKKISIYSINHQKDTSIGTIVTILDAANIEEVYKDYLEDTILDKYDSTNNGLGGNWGYLFDFKEPYDEIERVRSGIRKRKKKLEETLNSVLKNKVNNLTFKPTIRNIVEILCIHAQIFLETIREVSRQAEKNESRKKAIQKTFKSIHGNQKDKEIYPWLEYRKKDDKGSLVESWIGSDLPEGEYENVNEVMFVEELLNSLMKIGRKDELRELAGSANIPDFFPVSPAEAKIPLNGQDESLITKNPYYQALKSERSSGTIQEAIRCLLFRTFTSVGVTNRLIGNRHTKTIGKLEADNLLDVLNSEFDPIPKDNFIRGIRDFAEGSNGIDGAVSDITKTWFEGGEIEGVDHPYPSHDGKFFKKYTIGDKSVYRYNYITYADQLSNYKVNPKIKKSTEPIDSSLSSDETSFGSPDYKGALKEISYIPLSGGFDGKDFFPFGSSLEPTIQSISLSVEARKKLSEKLIFTSDFYKIYKSKRDFNNNRSIKLFENDGSTYFKILCDKKGFPLRGSPTVANSAALEEYKKGISESENEIKLINENEIRTNNVYQKKQFEQKPPTRNDVLDMYAGAYKTLVIDNIYYKSNPTKFQKKGEDTVIKSYFFGPSKVITNTGTYAQRKSEQNAHWNGGTFLARRRELKFSYNYQGDDSTINTLNQVYTNPEDNSVLESFVDNNELLALSAMEEAASFGASSAKAQAITLSIGEAIGGGGRRGEHNDLKGLSTIFNSLGSKLRSPLAPTYFDDIGLPKLSDNNKIPPHQVPTRELVSELIKGNMLQEELYVPFVDMSIVPEHDFSKWNASSFSLFGNLFYYKQEREGKAFLFLHSIAWEGVVGDVLNENGTSPDVSLFDLFENDGDSFNANDTTTILKAVYGSNGSFTKAPRLWCAFIGALLYRYDYAAGSRIDGGRVPFGADLLDFGDSNKYLFPYQKDNTYFPKYDEYLRYNDDRQGGAGIALVMDVTDNEDFEHYGKIDSVILNLPGQARDEFKRIFTEFVENDFKKIQKNYELFKNSNDLATKHSELNKKILVGSFKSKLSTNDPGKLRLAYSFYPNDLNFDINYGAVSSKKISISPAFLSSYAVYRVGKRNLSKFIKDDDIIDILGKGTNNEGGELSKVIKNYRNMSPIQDTQRSHTNGKYYKKYASSSEELNGNWKKHEIYQFDLTLMDGTAAQDNLVDLFSKNHDIMNASPRIFRPERGDSDSIDDDIMCSKKDFDTIISNFFIRFLELTKDRAEDKNDRIQKKIFNNVDDDVIKLNIYRTLSSINDKWLGGGTASIACTNIREIVNSFRFLDTGFLDIGDDFLVNPLSVQQKIVSNYNQSFFDLVNGILIENNFNFIALPSYIDFTSAKNMREAMFTPYTWSEEISNGTPVGASFVCVYVGQKSSNLNLDSEEHEDDGFSVISDGKCDDENGVMAGTAGPLPEVFQNLNKKKGYNIPYFLVSYGKGNQSIFKDIKLDQREFTETAESLEAINDISDTGDKSKASYKGQNLFNVYQKRAYSAEVEMMGNVTIQPMMYFQLNNIPMFKGAYLIHNTTHNITAHNMKTTFKGSRIKKIKTPLITEVQLFQSLIGSVSEGGKANTINDDTLTTNLSPNTVEENNVSPAQVGGMNFIDPMVITNGKYYPITSVPGPRPQAYRNGVKIGSTNHAGLDISTPYGVDLVSIGDNGVVELVKINYKVTNNKTSGYGLYVIIRYEATDGTIYRALYAHLSSVSKEITGFDFNNATAAQKTSLVSGLVPNKRISKGTKIGESGGSGSDSIDGKLLRGGSTGPHLHFEIREAKNKSISFFNRTKSIVKNPIIFLPLGFSNNAAFKALANSHRPHSSNSTA